MKNLTLLCFALLATLLCPGHRQARASFGGSLDLSWELSQLRSAIERIPPDRQGPVPLLARERMRALLAQCETQVDTINRHLWESMPLRVLSRRDALKAMLVFVRDELSRLSDAGLLLPSDRILAWDSFASASAQLDDLRVYLREAAALSLRSSAAPPAQHVLSSSFGLLREGIRCRENALGILAPPQIEESDADTLNGLRSRLEALVPRFWDSEDRMNWSLASVLRRLQGSATRTWLGGDRHPPEAQVDPAHIAELQRVLNALDTITIPIGDSVDNPKAAFTGTVVRAGGQDLNRPGEDSLTAVADSINAAADIAFDQFQNTPFFTVGGLDMRCLVPVE